MWGGVPARHACSAYCRIRLYVVWVNVVRRTVVRRNVVRRTVVRRNVVRPTVVVLKKLRSGSGGGAFSS